MMVGNVVCWRWSGLGNCTLWLWQKEGKRELLIICRGDVAGGCAAAGTLSLGRAREGQAVHRQKCPFGTAVVALRVYIAITGTVG